VVERVGGVLEFYPNSEGVLDVWKRWNDRFDGVPIREHLLHVLIQHNLPSYTLSVFRVNVHRLEGLKLQME
jgi:hypothetical protein